MRAWLVAVLCLFAGGAQAKPTTFQFDTVHTQVLFFASHLGFTHSLGRFPGVSGEFVFDPDDWSTARVDATIAVDSLYMGDAEWEKKVRRDLFDAERFPTMHFVSDKLTPIDAHRGRLEGQLTLHGVTRPIAFDVTLNRIGRHTFSFLYTAGFSATLTLKRSEFGMTRLLPAVGDEVEIRLEIEGNRAKKDNDEGT